MDQEEQEIFVSEEQIPTEKETPAIQDNLDALTATEPKKKNSLRKSILTYLHDFVYLLAVVLLLFLLCFRVVVVSGPSMMDTLEDGDYLLLLGSIFYDDYERGDIIVASKDSFRNGEPIVKRVIATEGQTVNIDFVTGVVYVDGVPLQEDYVRTPTNLYEGVDFPLVVEENHIFVMGDNRNDSKDSRSPEIGQVDLREVLGKAIFLIFPGEDESEERNFDRIGVID
ncbi:MAG: signal peptidase I [Ruminococcaceae bacterium]|nr:signal peptidase I [Oscillospiraceae bacterium]